MSSFFKGGTQKSTQDTKTSSTSVQKGKLDQKQKAMNEELFQQILSSLGMGEQVSESDRNLMRGQINDTYDASGKMVESNLAGRGFQHGGGKLGQGYGQLAIQRSKDFATGESLLKQQAMQRFQQMIQNAFAFNQPRKYITSQEGTSNTVGTQPGPSPFEKLLGYAGQGIGGAIGLGWQPFG